MQKFQPKSLKNEQLEALENNPCACVAFARACVQKLDELQTISTKLRTLLEKLEPDKNAILNHLDFISENESENTILYCSNLLAHIRKISDTLAMNLLSFDRGIYKLKSGEDLSATIGDYASAKLMFEEVFKSLYGVDYIVSDDALYLKLPMALPAFKNIGQSVFTKNKYSRSDKPLAEVMMQLIISENPDENFSYKYSFKSICYTFVYREKERRKALDSDNHETKAVTDAISFFLGDDDAASTSFCYSTEFTDAIESGTYITVVPNKNEYVSPESVIDLWRCHSNLPHESKPSDPKGARNTAQYPV